MMLRLVWFAAALLAAPAAMAGPGDPGRGQDAWEDHCTGCHSMDSDRTGPHHRGVIGRKAGSVPGFDYSDALSHAGFVWTTDLVEKWLTNPEALVPGQKMNYRINDPQMRADIASYLARESKR